MEEKRKFNKIWGIVIILIVVLLIIGLYFMYKARNNNNNNNDNDSTEKKEENIVSWYDDMYIKPSKVSENTYSVTIDEPKYIDLSFYDYEVNENSENVIVNVNYKENILNINIENFTTVLIKLNGNDFYSGTGVLGMVIYDKYVILQLNVENTVVTEIYNIDGTKIDKDFTYISNYIDDVIYLTDYEVNENNIINEKNYIMNLSEDNAKIELIEEKNTNCYLYLDEKYVPNENDEKNDVYYYTCKNMINLK